MKPSMQSFFDEVYREHCQAVHAFFLGKTGSRETAVELVQDTFLQVWRNIEMLHALEPSRRRYWIFSVAKNRLTDFYRNRASRAAAETRLSHHHETVAASGEPSEQAVMRETMRRLEDAINRLPEDLRTIVVMQAVGNMSSGDIGEALGVPAGTIRYKLSVARKKLADMMHREEGGKANAHDTG